MSVKERSDRTGGGHVLTRRKFANIRYPTDTETRKEYTHVTVSILTSLVSVKERSDRTGGGHVLTRRKFANIRYPTDTETRKEYTHVTVTR